MKRHKELLGAGLALCPVRLLGGFVCVDLHVGCAGCAWCLNRRDPALHRVLEERTHVHLPQVGISVDEVLGVAEATWSFSRARLAVRLGHLTDWRYQQAETAAFVEALPALHPVVVMTRFPLTADQRALVRGQRNLLIHLSLAPPVPGFEADHVPPERVMESVRGLPAESLFFMCRPLIARSDGANEALIDALPAGAAAGLHGLATDHIPGLPPLSRPPAAELARLRERASRRGVQVFDLFGCRLWSRLGRPFFKRAEAGDACGQCSNQGVCSAPRPASEDHLRADLVSLRLRALDVSWEAGAVHVRTGEPASRAEEVYLSERLGRPVTLSTVVRRDGPGVRSLEEDVIARWESSGFAPVAAMRELAHRVEAAVRRGRRHRGPALA